METHNIRYIVLHIVPFCDWRVMNYSDKMQFHHAVTASGKQYALKELSAQEGCIDIAFVGSAPYVQQSKPLFCMLLDLWLKHADAKIMYAAELYSSETTSFSAQSWLEQRLPPYLARKIGLLGNLFTLQSLMPKT